MDTNISCWFFVVFFFKHSDFLRLMYTSGLMCEVIPIMTIWSYTGFTSADEIPLCTNNNWQINTPWQSLPLWLLRASKALLQILRSRWPIWNAGYTLTALTNRGSIAWNALLNAPSHHLPWSARVDDLLLNWLLNHQRVAHCSEVCLYHFCYTTMQ